MKLNGVLYEEGTGVAAVFPFFSLDSDTSHANCSPIQCLHTVFGFNNSHNFEVLQQKYDKSDSA